MKLISTTLVGVGRLAETIDALQSASRLVDEFIVIDTAPLDAPVIRFSTGVHVHRFPWPGRFDVARNESLRLAAEAGADWSVFLDSDERIVCPDPAAVRAYLAALDPRVMIVCAHAADGTYQRERFFRGTIPQRWKFRTHESIDAGPGEQAVIPPDLISWAELPKTGEQVAAKSKRDVEMIREDLKEFPDEPRLWFYMGNSLAHIGPEHFEESIAAYRKVADVGVGEGCAWACFCAARLYFELSRIAGEKMNAPGASENEQAHQRSEMWRLAYKALDCCGAGLHKETRVAELHWLRACIHHGIGEHEQGQAYARQAKLHGVGSPSYDIRRGFQVPAALRGGPDLVEAWCLASIAAGKMPTPRSVMPSPLIYDETNTTSRRMADIIAETEKVTREAISHHRPISITVTSTGFHAEEWAPRCIESVQRQTFAADHVYVAADTATLEEARWARVEEIRGGQESRTDPRNGTGFGLLANLLPIWRSLPDDEVIVWLDGDDWLATDHALEIVAEHHRRGALVTYGSFMYADGRPGFAGQCGAHPRREPWRATHLKSFRAGLLKRIRDEDLRRPDGEYVALAIDRALMLPLVEMAAERAVYVPEVLCVYNHAHSFEANAKPDALMDEARETARIHAMPEYARAVWP